MATMRAWVLREEMDGDRNKMELVQVPRPEVEKGHVLVRLSAAALNHRDEWMRMKLYPAIVYDSVLGADGAGTAAAVGEGVSPSIVGKPVIIDSCCEWGDDQRSPSYSFGILGCLPRPGTLAEYISVPAEQVHPMPSHLTPDQAAALPLAALTAYRATMVKAQVAAGQHVLVTGIGGGVALFALQFAVAAGANVYVTSSSEEKIRRAIALGAKGGVNYRKDGWVNELRRLTGGEPLKAVIDGAGGESLNSYISLLDVGGIISCYGATAGPCKQLKLAQLFLKNGELRGSTMGSALDFANMLKLVNDRKIVPVVDSVLPMERGLEAFNRMRHGEQFGKLVIRTTPSPKV